MSRSEPRTAVPAGRGRRLSIVVGLIVLIWLLVGIRPIDPDHELVVREVRLLGSTVRVDGAWTLAPVGISRLTRYPLQGVELSLPGANDVALITADGLRYGLRGWATLRVVPDHWERIHAASAGKGLAGALNRATRRAAEEFTPDARSIDGPLAPTYRRQLELRLNEELAAVGLELRRLDLEGLESLSADGSDAYETATRLMLIGLDGADWEILDPLLEQGRLPHLKQLVRGGVRAKLLSISPLLSPVIWTTVATGVEPRRHGILDFLVDDPEGGSRQPVTSAQRQVPTVWEILSRSGVEVGVVGWWASWPADPVHGYLVSDRLAYQLFGYRSDPDDSQGKTWPPDLYPAIRGRIVAPDSVGWDPVRPYLSGSRKDEAAFDAEERKLLEEFRTLIAAGQTYVSIATGLRDRYDPRLEVVYLEGTDTVGHLFMPYRPPKLPGIDPERFDSFSGMVDRYYETADDQLGRLLQGRGDEWTVMVISDHGFATDSKRPRTADSRIGHGGAAGWHRRFGIFVLSGANVLAKADLTEVSVYDIAPTILSLFGRPVPRSWPGRVLGQVLDPAFLERHPVRFRDDDPLRDVQAGLDGLVDPAAAELLERLQSLGYVSSGPGSAQADSMTARNNAGVALMAEGRFKEAEAEFRAGLASTPGAPMLVFNLGMAIRFQGRTGEAGELFTASLDHAQTQRMAGHMLSQIRLEEGDLDEAERLARQVLEREPDAAEVHDALGRVLETRGDLSGAEAAYRRAAALDPDSALPRNNLGNLAKQSGDLSVAEQAYRAAIAADPYFMGAYNNLALVYQEQGRMKEAIDLYTDALTRAPENPIVLNNLASLYYATGDSAEARRLWSRAVDADRRYESPLNNLASLEINAERYDEAERLLRAALDLDPAYGDARLNLALVLRARGNLDAAREELRRATDDPRAAFNSWRQLGLFELELGYTDSAIVALERARDLTPRDPALWNALGEAYRRVGRRSDAKAAWEQARGLK